MYRGKWILPLVALGLFSPPVFSEVYRCKENGKTVLSSTPCAGSVTAPASPPMSYGTINRSSAGGQAPATDLGPDYSTPYGDWRGQVQFQATHRGQRIEAAHAVVPLVLSISAQGKVTGIVTENGCRLLGVAAPGIVPALLTLDLALSGCAYDAYNRRYSGSLTVSGPGKYASFSLNAYDMRPGATAAAFDLRATLRR